MSYYYYYYYSLIQFFLVSQVATQHNIKNNQYFSISFNLQNFSRIREYPFIPSG